MMAVAGDGPDPIRPAEGRDPVGGARVRDRIGPCCKDHFFAELTSALLSADDVAGACRELTHRAAALLEVADAGLLRPFPDSEPGFVATTSATARRAADIERELGEGPASTAHTSREIECADDLNADARWPGYADVLLRSTAVRTVLALPLRTGPDLIAVVVAYSPHPGHFRGVRRHHGELLTLHASAALGAVIFGAKSRNLEVALKTNREIATAVGIVMDRFRVTDTEALRYLREVSQRRHLKIAELADGIVTSGAIPRLTPGRGTRLRLH